MTTSEKHELVRSRVKHVMAVYDYLMVEVLYGHADPSPIINELIDHLRMLEAALKVTVEDA